MRLLISITTFIWLTSTPLTLQCVCVCVSGNAYLMYACSTSGNTEWYLSHVNRKATIQSTFGIILDTPGRSSRLQHLETNAFLEFLRAGSAEGSHASGWFWSQCGWSVPTISERGREKNCCTVVCVSWWLMCVGGRVPGKSAAYNGRLGAKHVFAEKWLPLHRQTVFNETLFLLNISIIIR